MRQLQSWPKIRLPQLARRPSHFFISHRVPSPTCNAGGECQLQPQVPPALLTATENAFQLVSITSSRIDDDCQQC
jgi:hypothetical protein